MPWSRHQSLGAFPRLRPPRYPPPRQRSERSLRVVSIRPRVRRRRIVALFAAGALVVGGLTAITANSMAASSSTPFGNLAEALQKSLYFYDAEKSGPARTLGRQPLEWRGDSEPLAAKIPLVTAPGTTKTGSGNGQGTNLSASFI